MNVNVSELSIDTQVRERLTFLVDAIYRAAEVANPSSSMLDVFRAQYQAHVHRNRHLELVRLKAAEAKDARWDVQFFCYQRRRMLDEDTGATNSARNNVVRRMKFETLVAEAQQYGLRARKSILRMWLEMSESNPDADKIERLVTSLERDAGKAEKSYEEIEKQATRAINVMRDHAAFLLEVRNDSRGYQSLLQDADRLELEDSKQHQQQDLDFVLLRPTDKFDVSNENAAVIAISAVEGRLGIIENCNSACLNLFGYTRREFIGQNINLVIPEPIATVHDEYIRKYLEDGKAKVTGTARMTLGLHRNGHLIPVYGSYRPMDDAFGALFEAVQISSGFLLFSDVTWVLTAICEKSKMWLDINLEEVRNGYVRADHYIPELPDIVMRHFHEKQFGVVYGEKAEMIHMNEGQFSGGRARVIL